MAFGPTLNLFAPKFSKSKNKERQEVLLFFLLPFYQWVVVCVFFFIMRSEEGFHVRASRRRDLFSVFTGAKVPSAFREGSRRYMSVNGWVRLSIEKNTEHKEKEGGGKRRGEELRRKERIVSTFHDKKTRRNKIPNVSSCRVFHQLGARSSHFVRTRAAFKFYVDWLISGPTRIS